jgi:hypothetical protein
MIHPANLASLLAKGRFSLTVEKQTQAEIDAFLREQLQGTLIEREKRLGAGDIPDFLIDGSIVVEVKVRGASKPGLKRQLDRYARYDCVKALILVTGVAVALASPTTCKPLFVVSLGRAWL